MGITILLGTVSGALHGFGGLVKLIPCGPGAKMASRFNQVWGPFLGCPGTCLRILIGLGELSAGFGILVGVWADAFGAFDDDLSDIVKALCIVAGVSLAVVGFSAAMMHCYIDNQTCSPALILGIISTIFTLIRVFAVDPQHDLGQAVATWLTLIVLVFAAIAMTINYLKGKHESTVQEANEKLNQEE